MAIRIPIPQTIETQRTPGFFTAPRVVNPQNPGAAQTQRLGQALVQTGTQVARAASDLEDRLNYTRVKRAQALGNEHIVDGSREFLNSVGDETSQMRDAAWERMSTKIDEIGEGLENDTQKILYADAMRDRMLAARQTWNGHFDTQSKVAAIGATKAVIEGKKDSAFDAALAAVHNPESDVVDGTSVSGRALFSLKAELFTFANMQGMTTPERDVFVKEQMTAVHSQVIGKLADEGRATKAREYLGKVSDDITAVARGGLETLLQRATAQEEGADVATDLRDTLDQEVSDIMSLSPQGGLGAAQVSAASLFAQGTEQVQQMWEDGKITFQVRQSAEAEIKRLSDQRRNEELLTRDNVRKRAEAALMANTTTSVDNLEPTLYREIVENDLLKDMRNFSGTLGRYGTNRELLYEIYQGRHVDLSRDEFINAVKGQLNTQEFNEALSLWETTHQVRAPKLTPGAGWATHVKDAARKLGRLTRNKAETDQLKRDSFIDLRNELTRRLNMFEAQKENGQPATDVEMQGVINRYIEDQVYVDDFLDDTFMRAAEVPEEEQRNIYVNRDQMVQAFRQTHADMPVPDYLTDYGDLVYTRRIPKLRRDDIIKVLRERGIPTSEANIAMLWVERQAEIQAGTGR